MAAKEKKVDVMKNQFCCSVLAIDREQVCTGVGLHLVTTEFFSLRFLCFVLETTDETELIQNRTWIRTIYQNFNKNILNFYNIRHMKVEI